MTQQYIAFLITDGSGRVRGRRGVRLGGVGVGADDEK